MEISKLKSTLAKSCKRVAPAWPLKNVVAVNPYLGFANTSFSETARILKRRGNINMTMPLKYYKHQITEGKIIEEDLKKAYQNKGMNPMPLSKVLERIAQGNIDEAEVNEMTISGIASRINGKDWNRHIIENITTWATSYFDDYIATWSKKEKPTNLYNSWKEEAERDLSNEIMGLKGFRAYIKSLPQNHIDTIGKTVAQLKINEEELEEYLHTLLLKVVGWSSYVSGLDYNKALYAKPTEHLQELLAILMAWESFFLTTVKAEEIKAQWFENIHNSSEKNAKHNDTLELQLILQDAFDNAAQREMIVKFKSAKHNTLKKSVKAQMIFCIDVRSEIYRRNLENVDTGIETLGFAGFFGFPVNYKPIAHEEGKNQCPVLIPSSAEVKESVEDLDRARNKRISDHQVQTGWKKFTKGAISNFGFVSPTGMSYLPKLIASSFNLIRPVKDPKTDGLGKWLEKGRKLDLSAIPYQEQLAMAQGMMNNLEVKDRLAPLVLITGHGSSSVNNPHASGYDCGACGGHSGEINALTAAQILNTPQIRADLKTVGISIPENTLFLACLHNTTTDEISILNGNAIPTERHKEVLEIQSSLTKASAACRNERARQFDLSKNQQGNIKSTFESKAKDWSEIRPEWGLVGCNAFVIAPREKTSGINLEGRAFLQSYDSAKDEGYGILEGIMSAPMVVTSWINLQYYASTADTYKLGAGNKTLHNVTGAFGVLEGSGGDLRIGLPLQAVHNGENFQHQPQRLNVVIAAPMGAINSILEKHEGLKQLCDNNWIKLLHLNEAGEIGARYQKDLHWETIDTSIEKIEKEYATV